MNGFRCLAAVLALVLAACGDGSVQSPAFTPVLKQIRISPETSTPDPLPVGRTVEFVAEGRFSQPPPNEDTLTDWQVLDDVSWESSDEAVASIDGDGIARGLSEGTTTIVASKEDTESAPVSLTVVAPVLDRIVIVDADDTSTPPAAIESATVPVGASQRYRALGVYSDSDQPRAIEGLVTWTSADTTVAAVDPATGATTEASGVSEGGPVVITAASGGISDTTNLTVSGAALVSFDEIRPETAVVGIGLTETFAAYGTFTDSTERRQIDNSLLDWTSGNTAVATVDPAGNATGVAVGSTTITATVKDGQFPTMAPPRSRSATLTVTTNVCTTPLRSADGATVESDAVGLCLLCSTQDEENIIDGDDNNFGTMLIPVGLLNGGESVTVSLAQSAAPFPAGEMPGFVVGRPAGQLVLAELFSQLEVSTLLNGTVQESSGPIVPLRLDLLGIKLVENSDQVLATLTSTLPYDAVRLTVKSGVATALNSLQVFNACGTTQPPVDATLLSLDRLEPDDTIVEEDSGQYFTAMGTYEGSLEGPVQPSALNWTTGDATIATVDAMGFLTALSAGTTSVTATLKEDASQSASTDVTVLGAVCAAEDELLASDGATVETGKSPTCLLCSVANEAAVVDEFPNNYATIALNLGLLTGSASITVNSPGVDFPAGRTAGFLVGRDLGQALVAELGTQLGIELLRDDAVVQSSSGLVPLRLDLLGINLTSNDQTALVSLESSTAFDSARLIFNSGLASALTSVNVYKACSDVTPPAAAP